MTDSTYTHQQFEELSRQGARTEESLLLAIGSLGGKLDSIGVTLTNINGRLRANEQAVAAEQEWKRCHEIIHDDHESIHADLTDELKYMRRANTVLSSVLGIGEMILAGALAIFRGQP